MNLNDIITILGIIFLAIISISLLLFSFGYLVEKINNLYDQWRYSHAVRTIHRMGETIKNEKYWYSESKEAMLLLECIGEAYMTSDSTYVSMDNIRSTWRHKLNEQNETEEQERTGTSTGSN